MFSFGGLNRVVAVLVLLLGLYEVMGGMPVADEDGGKSSSLPV